MPTATLSRPVRVFLVDDSPLVRERLERMLADMEGVRTVGHASEAEAAIRGILAEPPDVVVLDLKLDKGSGFDVLRAVHRAAPQIDIYMLSSFAEAPYRRLAERLGARGFYDKTCEFDRVRDRIAARAGAA